MAKDNTIKKLLVIRFSAMGDVAMTVPVVTLLARQNPGLRITVLTRDRFMPMYEWAPANVQVKGIDLNNYKGVAGLSKLFNELRKMHFDAVADLHDVLRTKYLRTCFRMTGTKVAVIDKGRKQKKGIIGNANSQEALPLMTDRYADVFRELGLDIDLAQQVQFDMRNDDWRPVRNLVGIKAEHERWIGIAPFAAHPQKVYPLPSMRKVVELLRDHGCKVFLFGAGKEESEELAKWEGDGVLSVCGKLGGLHNELLLISQLDAMLSMDSANMHMAAMLGTKTLSVWGATHPAAGFTAWQQNDKKHIIETPDLPCRPCSIYGNKACKFGDLRCMNSITPETILNKVLELI